MPKKEGGDDPSPIYAVRRCYRPLPERQEDRERQTPEACLLGVFSRDYTRGEQVRLGGGQPLLTMDLHERCEGV